jgi:serine/threonine-protein kinase HipA
LLLLIEGQPAGRILANRSGRLSLTYEPEWLRSEHAFSLSVSMQLGEITYPHKLLSPYLWNLLPENPNVLQRWAQQYHVSAANPFKLLTFVGADVPGAAQSFHWSNGRRSNWSVLPASTGLPSRTCARG